MIDHPWYNSVDGIEAALVDIGSFHAIMKARSAAYKANKLRLNRFIVHRRWYLDDLGQVGTLGCVDRYDDSLKRYIDVDISTFPDVMSVDQFRAMIPADTSWSYGFGSGGEFSYPAPAHIQCNHCGQPWSLGNMADVVSISTDDVINLRDHVGKTLQTVCDEMSQATDAIITLDHYVLIRNDRFIDHRIVDERYPSVEVNKYGWTCSVDHPRDNWPSIDPKTYVIQLGDEAAFHVVRYFHRACRRVSLTDSVRREMITAFTESGLMVHGTVQTENKYGSETWRGPWFFVDTNIGVFTVGWRKRVIDLNFSSFAPALTIKDDDVTAGPGYIHAWSYAKLTEYLMRVQTEIARAKP